MNILSLRTTETHRNAAQQTAIRFLQGLFNGDPRTVQQNSVPECEVFGSLATRDDWARTTSALAAIGGARVRETYGAPVNELSLGDHPEEVLGGPAHGTDQLVLLDIEVSEGEVTVGVLVDLTNPQRPKVRRVFDPSRFADLAA